MKLQNPTMCNFRRHEEAVRTLSPATALLVAVVMLTVAAFSPVTAAASKDTTKVDATTMKTSTAQLDTQQRYAADEIRPFRVHVPDAALADLRRRIAATASLRGFATGAVLLGAGTALVYPTLLAAIGDVAHPSWRASAVGVYRLWRDSGYAIGALLSA